MQPLPPSIFMYIKKKFIHTLVLNERPVVPRPHLLRVHDVGQIVLGHVEDGGGDGLGFDHGFS